MSWRDRINQVCRQCGIRYCILIRENSHIGITFWEGKCDVCNQTKSVTSIRHYRYLPLLTEVKFQEEQQGGEILRASEKLAKEEGR